MRLYMKFIAMLLLFAGAQRMLLSDAPPSELWFGVRCSYAYAVHDERMIERLVSEAADVGYWTGVRVNAARRAVAR